jgi:hypothetical protein
MAAQTGADVAAMPETGRESASAMTLDVPGTNTRMLVYFDMNARWRALLVARCRRRYPVEGENQRFVVGPTPKLERPAIKSGAEMFDT